MAKYPVRPGGVEGTWREAQDRLYIGAVLGLYGLAYGAMFYFIGGWKLFFG
jgi:hypothetical protein